MIAVDAALARRQAERLDLLERLRVEAVLTVEAFDEFLATVSKSVSARELDRFRRERDRVAGWLRDVEIAIAGD